MFKILIIFIFTILCISQCTVIKVSSYIPNDEFGNANEPYLKTTDEITSNWRPHIMEFLELMDLEKMVTVAMQYMSDPEVMTFMKFLFSPEFKNLIWEFEMMDEFKEAVALLTSKGYDVERLINFVNSALNLRPFEKPNYILRNEKGISGFLDAMVNALPLEDMKKLFESKLQSSPEVADLFETINSEDFINIMRRMRENPKFTEFRTIFESYGFDFKFTCKLIKDIFGNYYQGIFCD